MIQKWLDLGILMVEETLKEIILPKTALFVKLSDALLQDERLQHQALDQLKRSNAQLKLMAWLLSEPERGWMNRAELIRSFKGGEAAIRGLIKKNWLVQEKRSVETFEALAEENPSDHAKVELNADQQLALESLNQLLETKPAVLLHGVTGSGKTYVYARWIQELL
jgi:primosomal protein N' (replication factor Y)